MMTKLLQKMQHLADVELMMANENYPAFSSMHEGESVIREEMWEAQQETYACNDYVSDITHAVYHNDSSALLEASYNLEKHAIQLACEAVQVAAMAKKIRVAKKG